MRRPLLQFMYGIFGRTFLRLFVGVHLKPATFLKDVPQFIIVANHNSHLDTLTLMAAMPGAYPASCTPGGRGEITRETTLAGAHDPLLHQCPAHPAQAQCG